MDLQTLLYDLREEVSCPVCSLIFTDPKQLPCLHSFCLQCIQKWFQTSQSTINRQDTIICPSCRGVSRVPASGDLKDLPTSFFLNCLIDILAIKECNNTQVTCGNCDKKSSEASYCFQCCIIYCEECITAHNKMRSNKDHRALALKDFQDKDFEDLLKRPAFCPKQRHQNEQLKYFCKQCERAVCQTCSSLEHPGHALEHIEDEAKRQKNEIKALITTQRQNLQSKKDIVNQLDEDFAKVIQRGEDVKRDGQRFVEKVIAVIEAKKEIFFTAVENQTEKSLESLTSKRSKMEDVIKVMEKSLEKADNLFTRGTSAEIIQLKKSLEATISKQVVQTEPLACDPDGIQALVFVENQNLIDTANSQEIGSLELLHQSEASQSITDGKGLGEACAGLEAQFTLTAKNTEVLCYNMIIKMTLDSSGRDLHRMRKKVFT